MCKQVFAYEHSRQCYHATMSRSRPTQLVTGSHMNCHGSLQGWGNQRQGKLFLRRQPSGRHMIELKMPNGAVSFYAQLPKSGAVKSVSSA